MSKHKNPALLMVDQRIRKGTRVEDVVIFSFTPFGIVLEGFGALLVP